MDDSEQPGSTDEELIGWVYAASSAIHGQGLFAEIDLEKDLYLGSYDGAQVQEDDTYVLWVTYEDDSAVGRDGLNLLRYLNHSDTPNAFFDGFDLYLLSTVMAGEEITINYNGHDSDELFSFEAEEEPWPEREAAG